MKKQLVREQALIDAFVAAFIVDEVDTDGFGNPLWKPFAHSTDTRELEPLYALLPAKFPPLYEQLVLSYRWSPVELPYFDLLSNPPGPTLDGLLAQMQRDEILWDTLLPSSFVPFARGWGGNYDPVCFDLRHRQKDGDCPVVQIEHEDILCFDCIGKVERIAANFRDIVTAIVEQGADPRYFKATCP